jgi:APA family basic amino acid/polyamine antiporter
MMTSGQISLNLAEEGYFPKFFKKINKQSAPYIGLIIQSLLILPLLLLTADENILNQLKKIIDFSVTAFLYVYLICSISYIFIHIKSKRISFWKIFSTIIAIIFCITLILNAELFVHLVVLSFILSGIPLFVLNKRRTVR